MGVNLHFTYTTFGNGSPYPYIPISCPLHCNFTNFYNKPIKICLGCLYIYIHLLLIIFICLCHGISAYTGSRTSIGSSGHCFQLSPKVELIGNNNAISQFG